MDAKLPFHDFRQAGSLVIATHASINCIMFRLCTHIEDNDLRTTDQTWPGRCISRHMIESGMVIQVLVT